MKWTVLILLGCVSGFAQEYIHNRSTNDRIITLATAIVNAKNDNELKLKMSQIMDRIAIVRQRHDSTTDNEERKGWSAEWHDLKQQANRILDEIGTNVTNLQQTIIDYRRFRISLKWDELRQQHKELIAEADKIALIQDNACLQTRINVLREETMLCLRLSRSSPLPEDRTKWHMAYVQKLNALRELERELETQPRDVRTIIRIGPPKYIK